MSENKKKHLVVALVLLPFLGSLSVTPPVITGGVQPKFAFTLNVKFLLYPPPRDHRGGWHLNYPKTVNHFN